MELVLMDHFARLGLPRRFSVDAATLERAYLARSRELHPDRHQLASTAEQSASVELSAALNEAYQTLRDPFKRSEYLLSLAGGPTASEARDIPADFLDEMLDLRMEIGALKPETPAAEAMEKQLTTRRDTMLEQVGQILDTSDSPACLKQARRQLNAVKYVANLLRDLRAL
ncbi:Fe-S protein assembly co-chaperone HscB [Zavarzinella formosa]|uniref:Fe-S protein assembly co-chaperone HscB n=1 Tax=Zavarzinella formosa TaxID=360055 RepID=UPI0012F9370B|nr:Fe-S protein assembly co-chaperone HscB [Zavarzinella formosa]